MTQVVIKLVGENENKLEIKRLCQREAWHVACSSVWKLTVESTVQFLMGFKTLWPTMCFPLLLKHSAMCTYDAYRAAECGVDSVVSDEVGKLGLGICCGHQVGLMPAYELTILGHDDITLDEGSPLQSR